MTNKSTSDLRAELSRLTQTGNLLLASIAREYGSLAPETEEYIKNMGLEYPDIRTEYEQWYSLALKVIKQIIPDRIDDFVSQYKKTRRKAIDVETYTMSDYLMGLSVTIGVRTVDGRNAIPKLSTQTSILASALKVLDSRLRDLEGVVTADLFDSELEAAAELSKQGFLRAAGVVAGVILEKHLAHVCTLHVLRTHKKNPSIADYDKMLKDAEVVDLVAWRFIQHLGDLRNLCAHQKDRDPTPDDIAELIEGVKKVIRTVF
jgi:hypothetical protein